MAFNYKEKQINILDTPGHKDFAEDTYRTLTAVDSVIMVIDCANGVEAQTEKLMEVCRMRDTPVIVFINKMDREGQDAFDLLDEIESKLKIKVHPMSWPIGIGATFKGVYHMQKDELNLFDGNKTNIEKNVIKTKGIHDQALSDLIGEEATDILKEELELVDGVYDEFDREKYLEGKMAPVFFGSALNNFGVQELLNSFIHINEKELTIFIKSSVIYIVPLFIKLFCKCRVRILSILFPLQFCNFCIYFFFSRHYSSFIIKF